MLVSYNWLKEYMDLKIGPDKVAEKLTAAGLEVDNVKTVNDNLDNLQVAQVLSIAPHPDADKLRLVTLKSRDDEITVVCGAANVKEGLKVLLAREGAVLPGGFTIKKTKIRGVESRGMICSKEELGLEEKSEGIWELPSSARLTDRIDKYTGKADTIFDIDLTSNRSDCMSVYGVALELTAVLDLYFRPKDHKKYQNRVGNVNVKIEAPDKCLRYAARIVKDVKIGPSPDWLAHRLYQHGIRAINNVVDITNLVLIEYGQPLHAFDLDKLNDRRIIVRRAGKGETITTLEGEERKLTDEDLLICDGKGPVALAGIMGGLDSGIVDTTTDVLIESAYFEPLGVRRTSKRTGLSTDSSVRFEKGVDINRVIDGLNYAVELMVSLAGGSVGSGLKDVYPKKIKDKKVFLKYNTLTRYLGTELKRTEVNNYLSKLGFKNLYRDKEKIQLQIPHYRYDINEEWDMVEEVVRLYGYDNIPETIPSISNSDTSIAAPGETDIQTLASSLGYNQMINFSFVKNDYAERTGLDLDKLVHISNPIAQDYAYMRDSMLFGLLKNAKTNIDHYIKDQSRIYETGRVFSAESDGFSERVSAGFLGMGPIEKANWITEERTIDFYDLKGDMINLLSRMGHKNVTLKEDKHPQLSPAASARILIGGVQAGWIGRVQDNVLKYFDIKKAEAWYAELDVSAIRDIPLGETAFRHFSSFPSVYRDIALVMDAGYRVADLAEFIEKAASEVAAVTVSNMFSGEQIGVGRKSIVFSVEYSSMDATLSREDVDRIEKKICDKILKEFPVELR